MAYYLRKEKRKKGSIYKCMSPTGIKKRNSHVQIVSWLLAMSRILSLTKAPILSLIILTLLPKKMQTVLLLSQKRPAPCFYCPCGIQPRSFSPPHTLEELNVRNVIDILAAQMRFQFSVYDMIAQLIFSRVICPCSKAKTVSAVFPHLYNSPPISEDQVYDGLSFIRRIL